MTIFTLWCCFVCFFHFRFCVFSRFLKVGQIGMHVLRQRSFDVSWKMFEKKTVCKFLHITPFEPHQCQKFATCLGQLLDSSRLCDQTLTSRLKSSQNCTECLPTRRIFVRKCRNLYYTYMLLWLITAKMSPPRTMPRQHLTGNEKYHIILPTSRSWKTHASVPVAYAYAIRSVLQSSLYIP